MTGPLLTKADWANWVTAAPYVAPTFPSADELQAFGTDERERVTNQRMAHNGRAHVVCDDAMAALMDEIFERHTANQHGTPTARPGFTIDGPPRTGKSTFLHILGKTYEQRVRRLYPERFDQPYVDYAPVAYFSLPQSAGDKSTSAGLADYLGVIYTMRATEKDITRRVLAALRDMRVEFLLIDELHNLGRRGDRPGNAAAREANDYLKNLCNNASVTPVFAGVDLGRSGLYDEFVGSRVTQTSGRFTAIELAPSRVGTPDEVRRWKELIHALERPLHLYSHRRGDVTKQWRYLHERTGGFVGTLSQLIRDAAIRAISTGREQIDRELLETIRVDKQSQDAYERQAAAAKVATSKRATAARKVETQPKVRSEPERLAQ